MNSAEIKAAVRRQHADPRTLGASLTFRY